MSYQIENINKQIEILKNGQLKLSSMSVLVCLSCYNKYHRWVAYQQQKSVSHCWSAGSLRPRCQRGRGRLSSRRGLLLVSSWAEGARESCGISSIIPLIRASPSWPHCLPKVPPADTITSDTTISTYEFWRDTDIQAVALWSNIITIAH